MTPVILGILLHYYYSLEDYKGRNSCAEIEGKQYLINNKLIALAVTNRDSNYGITDRGRVYIEHLLKQPLPTIVTHWEIPKE